MSVVIDFALGFIQKNWSFCLPAPKILLDTPK
jgi:hypothetical protein